MRAWITADEDHEMEAEAASSLLAETVLLHRLWLKAQFKKDKE